MRIFCRAAGLNSPLTFIKQITMAGLTPTEIKLHQTSRKLEIAFSDGTRFNLPFEFLRVYSPSAEVRGHGPGQEVLQVGKREILVISAEPVGLYALNFEFSDGHNSGIFSWDYLHELGENYEDMWAEYLRRMDAAGATRDPGIAHAFAQRPKVK
jgi:DUF971 family protein